MSDDLVKRMRDKKEGAIYLEPKLTKAMLNEAANRIERLEAALRLCVCNCEKNCTNDNDDICEGWVCRKALEGKDER